MRSFPRWSWTLVPLAAAVLWAPAPACAGGLLGFRSAAAGAEIAREATVQRRLSPDTLRRHLRILTERPHVAGTPADRATAEYVRQRLEAYGWKARIEEVPVYLDYPGETRLELVEPQRASLAVREWGIEGDKDSLDGDVIDAFHGYGASGDVTAPVVYANYGEPGDFEKLAALGIDVRGKIVLVRYGRIFRGLKVRNAERAGAAGVVIYSDPADDGFARGDPYPRGRARPAEAIQRGSVQFLGEAPGDPTTPGWPSRDGGRRLTPSQARGIPRIPSLPIAWAEAEKILDALDGPAVPDGWQGGLPLTYHLGEGPAKLHLVTVHDYAVRPIWNVIATLEGREKDQWVVCGNHRDAWTYGALDPNSGTVAMLEMARTLGSLAQAGWRPRRTIVLCSWDGEEYGLLGSTEWCEAHEHELEQRAVAYLNVDVAVSGPNFRVNGVHALRDVLVQVLDDVSVAGHAGSVYRAWKARAWSRQKTDWARRNRERRWRGEPQRPFDVDVTPLGSGSDYTAFTDHLGVPAVDLRFTGMQGTYHSIYDDFAYFNRQIDPTYVHEVALAETWSRLAMRLAEAELLPLHYSTTGQFVLDELERLEDRIDDANAGIDADSLKLTADFGPLREAATRLRDQARSLEARGEALLGSDTVSDRAVAAINAATLSAGRAFLGDGLPGRPWFRHEIYAPGLDTGYAAVPLPRLGQAVLDRDRRALEAGLAPLRRALERAADALAQEP